MSDLEKIIITVVVDEILYIQSLGGTTVHRHNCLRSVESVNWCWAH